MRARSIMTTVAVIALAFANTAVASISTPVEQATPFTTTIQLAEQEQSDNIQLAAQGRHTAFIAGALVGGIAAHAYTKNRYNRGSSRGYRRGSYRNAQDRCARRYRSYSYRTDTYVTYSGYEKLCPYVRPWY